MTSEAYYFSSSSTGYFSTIVQDYLNQSSSLRPFYAFDSDLSGIRAAIEGRKARLEHRDTMVAVLEKQYAGMAMSASVMENLQALKQENVYTVCTAHQPNLFTGPLYFVYKILHAIALAAHLNQAIPENRFVPVFYMGSEDADLDELGHLWLNGEKLVWGTQQTGAFGRMKPAGLEPLLNRIAGELSVLPFGNEILELVRTAYLESEDVQTATFKLVNAIFGKYGLIVLIPDQPDLKRIMLPLFTDELLNARASSMVEATAERLSAHYKVQAHPREINLFYLKDDLRVRIEKEGDQWIVVGTEIRFSETELMAELEAHPERFSPNVILRGMFQETILPNIAFIGGGGEMAYWLELKAMFDHYQVPFPVLILRNSFLLMEKKWEKKWTAAGLDLNDLFTPGETLLNQWVRQHSGNQLSLANELDQYDSFYHKLKSTAGAIDPSLTNHVDALYSKSVKRVRELEKKMLRAEKRKFGDQRRQIELVQQTLFPGGGLQERKDNMLFYYAKWGSAFIDLLLQHSHALEQDFALLVVE